MNTASLENMNDDELAHYVENNLLANPLERLLATRLLKANSKQARLTIAEQEKNKRLIEAAREFSERFLDMFDSEEN